MYAEIQEIDMVTAISYAYVTVTCIYLLPVTYFKYSGVMWDLLNETKREREWEVATCCFLLLSKNKRKNKGGREREGEREKNIVQIGGEQIHKNKTNY